MNTYHYLHSRSPKVEIPAGVLRTGVCVSLSQIHGAEFILLPLSSPQVSDQYVSLIVQNLPEECATFNIIKGAKIVNLNSMQSELDSFFSLGVTEKRVKIPSSDIKDSILRYFGRLK